MTEKKHGSKPAWLTPRHQTRHTETVPTMPLYKAHRSSRHRDCSNTTLARWLSRTPSQRQHRVLLPCVLRYQTLQDVRCRAFQLCTTNTSRQSSGQCSDPLTPPHIHPKSTTPNTTKDKYPSGPTLRLEVEQRGQWPPVRQPAVRVP